MPTSRSTTSTAGAVSRSAAAAIVAAALVVTLASCTQYQPRDTYELHYTTFSNASSDQTKTAMRWAEEVERRTDGNVTIKLHHSASLLAGDEAAQGTTDGRADLAHIASIYATSDLPLLTISELPFETSNTEAHMIALQRLYDENEDYRASFESRGLIQLFPLPLGNAVFGTTRPINSPDELAGHSIRASGMAAEIVLEQGANPVALSAGDIYESMDRGIIDGYTLALANTKTFGLSHTTPYLVDPGIGAWSSAVVVINQDLYESMPPDYQRAIADAAADTISFGLTELDTLADEACADLRSSGTEFITFSPEDRTAWAASTSVTDEGVAHHTERGHNAQAILDDYRRIIAEEEARSTYVDPLTRCKEAS